jgi:predicted ATP-binding protein involved in virulence
MQFKIVLKRIELKNFRLFTELDLPFHERITVFIGENGAGKTTVLEGIAKSMEVLTNRMRLGTIDLNSKFIDSDINVHQSELNIDIQFDYNLVNFVGDGNKDILDIDLERIRVEVEITKAQYKKIRLENDLRNAESDIENQSILSKITLLDMQIEKWETMLDLKDNDILQDQAVTNLEGNELAWNIVKSRKDTTLETFEYSYVLDSLIPRIHNALKKGEPSSIPVIAYYPFDRTVRTVSVNGNNSPTWQIFSTYDQSLEGVPIDFKMFFDWYKVQEDRDLRGIPNMRKYVEQAILRMLNDEDSSLFGRLTINPDDKGMYQMLIEKEGTFMDVALLSSGEKSLLVLVADIARRLAIANPNSDDPLNEGTGIILIDEIDLHLHPRWQRKVIPQLLGLFPKVQFVVTTHSPFVLQQVSMEQVLILDNGEVFSAEATKGQPVSKILEVNMETSGSLFKDEISHINSLISIGELEKAKLNIHNLEAQMDEPSPELIQAKALIKRKELLSTT